MSSPLDEDYTDQQTSSSWASDGTPSDTSFGDVDAEGASDLATLPGYSVGTPVTQTSHTSLPDHKLAGIPSGPGTASDVITTEADTESAQQILNHLTFEALPSLTQAARTNPDLIASGAGPPANPMGPTVNPWQPPDADSPESDTSLVNTWTDTSTPGFLSAQLIHADYGLLSAVAAAGSSAGGQAALVAHTVAIDPVANTITAGGSQPVGSRNTPASALAAGSEYNTARQFHCGPWFFPAVAAWAADNPPPAPPQDQQLAPPESEDTIEPGSQFAAEGNAEDAADAVTENAADRMI